MQDVYLRNWLSRSTLVVVSIHRREEVTRVYHLPVVPKIRWAVKNVIFKIVPSGKLCSVSFLLACHRKEGINNCLIFVFNTPNI